MKRRSNIFQKVFDTGNGSETIPKSIQLIAGKTGQEFNNLKGIGFQIIILARLEGDFSAGGFSTLSKAYGFVRRREESA